MVTKEKEKGIIGREFKRKKKKEREERMKREKKGGRRRKGTSVVPARWPAVVRASPSRLPASAPSNGPNVAERI